MAVPVDHPEWRREGGDDRVAENPNCDHPCAMDRVLRGAVRDLVEDGEHYKTVKATEKWYDWLAEMGGVVRAPERRELDMNATVDIDKQRQNSTGLSRIARPINHHSTHTC